MSCKRHDELTKICVVLIVLLFPFVPSSEHNLDQSTCVCDVWVIRSAASGGAAPLATLLVQKLKSHVLQVREAEQVNVELL